MENNRNQQNRSDISQTETGQNRNTSDINVENPQRGGQWENYQTRELSSNAQSGSKTNIAGADSGSESSSGDQEQRI